MKKELEKRVSKIVFDIAMKKHRWLVIDRSEDDASTFIAMCTRCGAISLSDREFYLPGDPQLKRKVPKYTRPEGRDEPPFECLPEDLALSNFILLSPRLWKETPKAFQKWFIKAARAAKEKQANG
jgi:hypothetical protein